MTIQLSPNQIEILYLMDTCNYELYSHVGKPAEAFLADEKTKMAVNPVVVSSLIRLGMLIKGEAVGTVDKYTMTYLGKTMLEQAP